MAEEAKAKGNAALSSKNYTQAITHFTEAINLAPTNHFLYSNRSAAYASLGNFSAALSDAEKTVSLKPDWAKGYGRLGSAHLGLRNVPEAVEAYTKGLDIDPNIKALKTGLKDAKRALPRENTFPKDASLFGGAFSGPEMWAKLTADPTTRAFLQQPDEPDYVRMMQDLQKNLSNLNLDLQDQRVMQSFLVLLNIMITAGGDRDFPMGDAAEEAEMPPAPKSAPAKKEEEKKEEKKVVVEEVMDEGKAEAKKEKELGNAAYKKKDFETAIGHYSKAIELDDEDISYLTNRAAVYLEMGKYDECIKDCDKAVERGRELRSDYKMVARALTRKGTALVKLAKTSKDYDLAIEAFNKALTEHRNPDTLKKRNDAEKAKKDLEQLEYFDPKVADGERDKGTAGSTTKGNSTRSTNVTKSAGSSPSVRRLYSTAFSDEGIGSPLATLTIIIVVIIVMTACCIYVGRVLLKACLC